MNKRRIARICNRMARKMPQCGDVVIVIDLFLRMRIFRGIVVDKCGEDVMIVSNGVDEIPCLTEECEYDLPAMVSRSR